MFYLIIYALSFYYQFLLYLLKKIIVHLSKHFLCKQGNNHIKFLKNAIKNIIYFHRILNQSLKEPIKRFLK